MKLKKFMDNAYKGKIRSKSLDTHKGDIIFGLEDLAERVGRTPTRADVERLAPLDSKLLSRLILEEPSKKHLKIWGYLTSIAAERNLGPLKLPARDFAGHELSSGVIMLEKGSDHIGEKMKGGKIIIKGKSGDYLGQEMVGGGIITGSCGDYAFRNMCGGWGVVLGDAGDYLGLGNSGGRLLAKGSCGNRTGWLMHKGRIRVNKDAGDYLGLLMSGGEIVVHGKAGTRAGWRMRGGLISASQFGAETGSGAVGGKILCTDLQGNS